MLISVHIPKTAGRSFRSLLKEEFGNKLLDDYADSPLNKTEAWRKEYTNTFKNRYTNYGHWKTKLKGTQCIHGHFLPYKYQYHLHKKNAHFVTWLRDPLDRLVSHYFYRKKMYEKTAGTPNQKIMHNFESFEAYCFDERSQNAYSKFLYKFPIDQFSFVGIVEHFNEDFKYFTKAYFNKDINHIPKKGSNSKKESLECLNDDTFIEKVKQLNMLDYNIYYKAVDLRIERANKNSFSF